MDVEQQLRQLSMTQTRAFSIRELPHIYICNQDQFLLLICPCVLQMQCRSLSWRCWRTLMEVVIIPSLSRTCALHISAALLSITWKRPIGKDSMPRPSEIKHRKLAVLRRRWWVQSLCHTCRHLVIPKSSAVAHLTNVPWLTRAVLEIKNSCG